MKKVKRRRYFVNKAFQLFCMGLVMVPLLALLAALYYLIYYAVFREMLVPEAVVVTLLPAMRKVNLVLLFSLPIIFFLILRRVLIYSNRFIGPVARIEKEIDKAIAGDYSVRVQARKEDVLNGFADKINMLLDKLGRREEK